ncbi:MAG: Dihydropteroate synthase [Verrucomicrobia subdivision 3 bacterium]|nr:Dihydropteroate synthase [Limisphaerales bacterium]MCS1412795.1 Dihydropteroate synthase [Limisphaerales bacterium]
MFWMRAAGAAGSNEVCSLFANRCKSRFQTTTHTRQRRTVVNIAQLVRCGKPPSARLRLSGVVSRLLHSASGPVCEVLENADEGNISRGGRRQERTALHRCGYRIDCLLEGYWRLAQGRGLGQGVGMMQWKIGGREMVFGKDPVVMGILNLTPDSFSDGGMFLDPNRAVDRALEMVSQGAGIIDIGGESTRPSAPHISLEEERRRVLPVLERLIGEVQVPLSIDTQKPELAREALSTGVEIVNDVGAARFDPSMLEVVGEFGSGYVCMHMKGTPGTMQHQPTYFNVVAEIDEFFAKAISSYLSVGLASEQVVLDVGIGFGKTVLHNLELIHHVETFKKHGRPIVLGVSRKSFIGKVLGIESAAERLAGSLACACWGLHVGAAVFRVHDVLATSQALAMWQAIKQTV